MEVNIDYWSEKQECSLVSGRMYREGGERKGANFHGEIFSQLEVEEQGIWIENDGQGTVGKGPIFRHGKK